MRKKKHIEQDLEEIKYIMDEALEKIKELDLIASKFDLTEHDKLYLSNVKDFILLKANLEMFYQNKLIKNDTNTI